MNNTYGPPRLHELWWLGTVVHPELCASFDSLQNYNLFTISLLNFNMFPRIWILFSIPSDVSHRITSTALCFHVFQNINLQPQLKVELLTFNAADVLRCDMSDRNRTNNEILGNILYRDSKFNKDMANKLEFSKLSELVPSFLIMMITPNSCTEGGGEEGVWRNFRGGGGQYWLRGMVPPSQQHVAPCAKDFEWGLETKGLRIVAAFWAGITVTQEAGVVPRHIRATIRTSFQSPYTTRRETVGVFYSSATDG